MKQIDETCVPWFGQSWFCWHHGWFSEIISIFSKISPNPWHWFSSTEATFSNFKKNDFPDQLFPILRCNRRILSVWGRYNVWLWIWTLCIKYCILLFIWQRESIVKFIEKWIYCEEWVLIALRISLDKIIIFKKKESDHESFTKKQWIKSNYSMNIRIASCVLHLHWL